MSKNPSAIITGAGSGIGAATALAFVRDGYNLTLVDIAEEKLDETISAINHEGYEEKVLKLTGDLADLAFVEEIPRKSYEQWGRIDVVINNAAWRTIETMRNISPENWQKTLQVCLTAPAFLSKWAAEYMEKDKKNGVILNISSVMARRAGGFSPAYIASKGAIESLTNELAALYGPSGIRVVSVAPGNVNTPLNDDLKSETGESLKDKLVQHVENHTPLGRSAMSEELARVLLWLAGDKASFISGTTISVDGGFLSNFNSYELKHLQFPKDF